MTHILYSKVLKGDRYQTAHILYSKVLKGRGAGSSTVPYFPRNAVVAGRWCPVRSLMQSISFQSHYQTIFHETATAIPARTARSAHALFMVSGFPRAGADGPAGATPLGLVGVSSWRPWWAGAPLLEPAHDRTVGRVHCPKWSLDLFLLQGLPLETRWLPASALWEGLDRSWFVTTCFLAYGTCVCRRCTLLGYSG